MGHCRPQASAVFLVLDSLIILPSFGSLIRVQKQGSSSLIFWQHRLDGRVPFSTAGLHGISSFESQITGFVPSIWPENTTDDNTKHHHATPEIFFILEKYKSRENLIKVFRWIQQPAAILFAKWGSIYTRMIGD